MNYCVLNGVKSTTIKGLLIQSLPPITKPLMRTSIETIDGRDGDIITPLGFSAYDKVMSIGLFGDYNVDEVIQYFTSEGTVTFSNEPDKYYNYQILNQIDFERLIKFKTATVTLHVQPFKYSALQGAVTYNPNMISIPNWSKTSNGVTLNVWDGIITISGTATAATEFYLPINPLTLDADTYTLEMLSDGAGESYCSIRLIGDIPSNADSFNNTYLPLQNNGYASMTATLTASKTFNYLWFYITAGTMNFTLTAQMLDTTNKSLSVVNSGNTTAKPKITIYGSGTINLSLNGAQIFVISIGEAEFITIDAAQMNAYQGNILMNRSVTGDYSELVFSVGTNTLTWIGNVTQISIENYTRWI